MSKWKQVLQLSHIPVLIGENGVEPQYSVTQGQNHSVVKGNKNILIFSPSPKPSVSSSTGKMSLGVTAEVPHSLLSNSDI